MKKFGKSVRLSVIFGCIFCVISFSSCVTAEKISKFGDFVDDPFLMAVGASINSIEEATEEFTPENEYYIGRSVAANIIQTYGIDKENFEMTEYLNEICGAITMNSEMPYLYKGYSVAILDTDEINAMATPGGHIFISRGLIQNTNSEDSLASVIAHEIAHIQLKHSMGVIRSTRITGAVVDTAKAGILAGISVAALKGSEDISDEDFKDLLEITDKFATSTSAVVSTLVTSGFSKDQEFEADKKALFLMKDAGYDPSEMIEMLTLINEQDGEYGWGATHPKPKDRIKNVKSVLSKEDIDYSDYEYGKTIRDIRFKQMMKNFY